MPFRLGGAAGVISGKRPVAFPGAMSVLVVPFWFGIGPGGSVGIRWDAPAGPAGPLDEARVDGVVDAEWVVPALPLAVGVGDADRVALAVGVGVAEADRVALTLGVGVGEAERVGLALGVGVAEADRVGLAVDVGVGEAERVGLAVDVGVGEAERVGLALTVGVGADVDAEAEGDADFDGDGGADADGLGKLEVLGPMLELAATEDGEGDGELDGSS